MNKEGIATGVFIEGIGTFDVVFYPYEGTTYENMIDNKKYVAKKFLEQLNKIYITVENDLNKDDKEDEEEVTCLPKYGHYVVVPSDFDEHDKVE